MFAMVRGVPLGATGGQRGGSHQGKYALTPIVMQPLGLTISPHSFVSTSKDASTETLTMCLRTCGRTSTTVAAS